MVSVAGFLVDSAAAGGSNILEGIERFLVVCCVLRTGFRRWFVYGFRRGRKTLFDGFRRWFVYGFRRGEERFFVYGFRRCCFHGFRPLQDRGCLSDGIRKK